MSRYSDLQRQKSMIHDWLRENAGRLNTTAQEANMRAWLRETDDEMDALVALLDHGESPDQERETINWPLS